jgi:phenylalanyl-tRNA synthetase beta chain
MKLSNNWLAEYVDIPEAPRPLGLRLTMATAEIEGHETHGSDTVFDIDNKSLTHRPDLWGHYGFAREVAAIYENALKPLELAALPQSAPAIEVEVPVSAELCPRYNALVIENISVGPSPDWLVEKLEALGARSINNIVDLTNYVLYEVGQPMHAFDRDKLAGNKIIVRMAHEGERLATLDGGEHTLTGEMLVIADSAKAVALAGVMGGANSEVDAQTTALVLESANFHPTSVRRTAGKLAIRTESSMRFEKGLDPVQTETGIRRFVALLQKICPDLRLVGGLADQSRFSTDTPQIQTRLSWINRKLGTNLPNQQIVGILSRLGFGVEAQGDDLQVKVPSWRATGDISIPEDLVEEVGRVYGYDNIIPVAPLSPVEPVQPSPLHTLIQQLRQLLSGSLRFSEVLNYAFVGEKLLAQVGLNPSDHLALANPLASDQNLLRTSLVPNMLKITAENLRFRKNFAIYELDRVFQTQLQSETIFEHENFALCALLADVSWKNASEQAFYAIKGQAEHLLSQLNLAGKLRIFPPAEPENLPAWCHPGRSAEIFIDQTLIGRLSQLHPLVAENMEIKAGVGLLELDISTLLTLPQAGYVFAGVQKYPTVPFDISLICPEQTLIGDVENCILASAPAMIQSLKLFDVYRGDNVGTGQKSLAFTVTFAASDHTLGPDEIEGLQQGVISALEAQHYLVRKG